MSEPSRGEAAAAAPWGYRGVRAFARFASALFYRDVELIGAERVPPRGPLIVAANHQNALVDPMLLVATLPRRLRPLAKAPLFKHPLVRPFLAAAGAVPVHRAKESSGDAGRNAAMFAATARALANGEAILIFPEGVGHFEPALQPLRTGAARMLLGAEALGSPPVTLLPVGLVFRQPGRFRSASGAVLVGKAIATRDCVALYPHDPETAVRTLTARLEEGLRHQIIEADTWRTEFLLRVAASVWHEEHAVAGRPVPADATSRTVWLREVGRAYRALLEREPERLRRLRRGLEAYSEILERSGLRGRHLEQSYSPAGVLRYATRQVFLLLVTLPLAFAGTVLHGPGFWLTDTAVGLARPQPDTEATYKILGGLLFYPLTWAVEGWLAFRLGGPWALAAVLLALLPCGFFALTWRERFARAAGEALAFWRYLRHPDLRRHLAERREQLYLELSALAELVEPGPAGGQR